MQIRMHTSVQQISWSEIWICLCLGAVPYMFVFWLQWSCFVLHTLSRWAASVIAKVLEFFHFSLHMYVFILSSTLSTMTDQPILSLMWVQSCMKRINNVSEPYICHLMKYQSSYSLQESTWRLHLCMQYIRKCLFSQWKSNSINKTYTM